MRTSLPFSVSISHDVVSISCNFNPSVNTVTHYTIYDPQGNKTRQGSFNGQYADLRLRFLEKGLYRIVLESGEHLVDQPLELDRPLIHEYFFEDQN